MGYISGFISLLLLQLIFLLSVTTIKMAAKLLESYRLLSFPSWWQRTSQTKRTHYKQLSPCFAASGWSTQNQILSGFLFLCVCCVPPFELTQLSENKTLYQGKLQTYST